jgi:hypothetical protein
MREIKKLFMSPPQMSVTSGESRLRKEIQNVDKKAEDVRKILRKFENINANDLIQSLSQNLMSFMTIGRDKFMEFFKTEVTTLEAKVSSQKLVLTSAHKNMNVLDSRNKY